MTKQDREDPFIAHKAIAEAERRLFKVEKSILKSRLWARMMKAVDIGVKHPKAPRLRIVEIGTFSQAESLQVAYLATAVGRSIIIDRQFFRAMGPRFLKKILTHELIHCYLYDNKVSQLWDGDSIFESCLKFLKCDIDIRLTLEWKDHGQRKWRND